MRPPQQPETEQAADRAPCNQVSLTSIVTRLREMVMAARPDFRPPDDFGTQKGQ